MIKKLKKLVRQLIMPEAIDSGSSLPERFIKEAGFLIDPLDAQTINYSMYISLQHRYLYVETPKVASSSIKISLQKLELDDHTIRGRTGTTHDRRLSPLLQPSQIHRLEEFIQRDDLFKFCFVRNPYSRMLSAYLNKIMNNRREKHLLLKQMKRGSRNVEQFISFEDFVEGVGRLSAKERDPHWREQHHQLLYSKIHYHYIGYFEDIDSDLGTVLEEIVPGGSAYYSKVTYHSTQASQKLMEYFTQDILDRVTSIYAKDFDTFGYEPIERLPASAEEWESGLRPRRAQDATP